MTRADLITMPARIALALALIWPGATLPAQEIEVQAEMKGRGSWLLSVDSENDSVLDQLAAIADACGHELDLGSPAVARALGAEIIDVHVADQDLMTLVELLATSCGYDARIDSTTRKITIAPLPEDDDEVAIEFYRQEALEALIQAYGEGETAQEEIELVLRSARLQLSGKDYDQAVGTYDRFLAENPRHPLYAEAAVAAAHAAYMAGRHDDVQRIVRTYMEETPSENETLGMAEVIAARSRLANGDFSGGFALLKSVIRRARDQRIDQRDGIIAEILLAEAHHRRGEDEEAIRILEEAEIRYDRERDEDLMAQFRLYLGICRNARGNVRDALHDLELAAYEVMQPKLRVRTMLLHSELLLDHGDPFLALASARVAMGCKPEGPLLFEVRLAIGRALHGLQLEDEAARELISAVLDCGSLVEDMKHRRELVSATLREIGGIFLDRGMIPDAIRAFESVVTAADRLDDEAARELAAECRFLIADAHLQSDAPKLALQSLSEITGGVTNESLARDIRRLEGDCYMALNMPERALRVWQDGGSR